MLEQGPVPAEGWHYLDYHRQSQGPFTLEYLKGLSQQGYFQPEVLFWREEQPEWAPLKALPALHAALLQGGAAAAPAAKAAAPAVVAHAAAAAPAAAATAGTPDAELAGFFSEISALEADAGAGAGADGGSGGAASPPPDEWRFTDDDGTEYEWDPALRKFLPLGEAAAAAVPEYRPEDMVFEVDEEVIPEYKPPPRPGDESSEEEEGPEAEAAKNAKFAAQRREAKAAKKRAREGSAGEGDAADGEGGGGEGEGEGEGAPRTALEKAMDKARERAVRVKEAKEAKQGWFDLKKNTSVYITGLPEDVTEAEVGEAFGKCGIIKEDDERKPRVKVYRDPATGRPKGDGLVTYLREPSVGLALQLLDGTPLRYGLPNMSVSEAKFELKGPGYVPKAAAASKKVKKRKVELQEKALGWHGFDDRAKPAEVTVIIKHMFDPGEFAEDPFLREELERDVTGEAAKLGTVEKVRVFQNHPEGVVSVKFRTPDSAAACIKVMAGRLFGGRRLEASLWDGIANYNVKKAGESAEEQAARLEAYAAALEAAEEREDAEEAAAQVARAAAEAPAREGG